MTVAAVAALLLGTAWAVIGMQDIVRGVPEHYVETTGIVVGVSDGPVIGFEDLAGTQMRFLGTSEAQEGEVVTVFYDPTNPAGTAETAEGRSVTIRSSLIIATILIAIATSLGVAANRLNRD